MTAFSLARRHPPVMLTLELEPLMRTLFEVVAVGTDGAVHYFWWDSLGNTGHLAPARSEAEVVRIGARYVGRSPGRHRSSPWPASVLKDELVFMIDDAGAFRVLLSAPGSIVLDSLASYRTLPGPVLISRLPGQLDIVAIDDGGNLRWGDRLGRCNLGHVLRAVRQSIG